MENVGHSELENAGLSEREIEKSRQINWLMHGMFWLQFAFLVIEVWATAAGHMPSFHAWMVLFSNPIPYLFGIATQRGIRQLFKEGQITEKGSISCIDSVNNILLLAYVCLAANVGFHFVN